MKFLAVVAFALTLGIVIGKPATLVPVDSLSSVNLKHTKNDFSYSLQEQHVGVEPSVQLIKSQVQFRPTSGKISGIVDQLHQERISPQHIEQESIISRHQTIIPSQQQTLIPHGQQYVLLGDIQVPQINVMGTKTNLNSRVVLIPGTELIQPLEQVYQYPVQLI